MTLHVHKLEGCAPTPLAHYLKALAILRLVSEQRDPEARGFWRDEAFWLVTKLSREDLLRFFLDEYAPTPILSPWNGGSGFYKNWDEKAGDFRNSIAVDTVDYLRASTAPRLGPLRTSILAYDRLIAELSQPIDVAHVPAKERGELLIVAKGGTIRAIDKDEGKDHLLKRSAQLDDKHGAGFVHAAVSFLNETSEWVPLWGRGGTDGKMEFPNNFLRRVIDLFDENTGAARQGADVLLRGALYAQVVATTRIEMGPFSTKEASIGFFAPGCAGGANMGEGYESASAFNPWDFVLMLEGAMVLAASVVRRTSTAGSGQGVSAPFALYTEGIGHGASSTTDEFGSKFRKFEQWFPFWQQPTTLNEVRSLFSEGRVSLKKRHATTTEDFTRSLARLGAARGISQFERYGYLERNGQANLAVPLGRWTVSLHLNADLLDDIGDWVDKLHRFARDDRAPKAITSAARVLDESILAVCRTGGDCRRWQALLVALGRAESALLRSPSKAGDPKRGLSPLPPLRPAWIAAADDGSPELRLALALASQDVALRHDGKDVITNVRAHWMPLDRSHTARFTHGPRVPARFAADSNGLANDPDVVCTGDKLERDCMALVRRRIQTAPALPRRGLGPIGARHAEAPLADVMAFLSGHVDDARILSLARPLMAIEWWSREVPRLEPPPYEGVDAAYAVARIAHLSEPLDMGDKLTIALDAEPITRLAAGDLPGAVAVCLRRLRASGLSPVVRVVAGDERYARRLAASLAFPIRAADVIRCARLITKPYEPEETVHAD